MGKKSSSSSSSSSSDFKATDLRFHELQLFITNARGLRNVETVGKLDPYVIAKVGSEEVTSQVFSNAGCDPVLNLHFRMRYSGKKTIRFIVKDRKRLGRDKECGRGKIKIRALSGKIVHQVVKLSFSDKKGGEADSGFMSVGYRFQESPIPKSLVESYNPEDYVEGVKIEDKIAVEHAFKSMKISVFKATNLIGDDKIDPYCQVQMGERILRSETMNNAGPNPKIMKSFHMQYHGHRFLKVKIFHDALKDKAIGSTKIDMLPFFDKAKLGKSGRMNVALKGRDKLAGGSLDMMVDFLDVPLAVDTVLKVRGSSSSSSSSS